MKIEKLQFITDSPDFIKLLEQVEIACDNGVKWIQFRMKNETLERKLIIGYKIKAICKRNNVVFIINDDVEIAKKLDADGVHLGLSDMNPLEARKILGEGKIIGATCNTTEDIIKRNSQKVDYIGLGPLRFTSTKNNLSPVLGKNGYSNIIKKMKVLGINIPIIAIGGLLVEDIKPLIDIGVYGIAVSSLINHSTNKNKVINSIINTIN